MKRINRREFFRTSSKGAAGMAAAGAAVWSLAPSSVLGANERVNMAIIGCGGRGPQVARGLIEHGARFTHVCDLHPERLDQGASTLGELQGFKPKKVKEIRQALDSDEVDAVLVSTPDHWHGPASILALQAGKDVYVEKPHAHNIWESRKMLEAARKYRRVLQVGTQNRSAPYNHAAREYIKSGGAGDIRLVKVYNLKPGGPFKLGTSDPKPKGFDWDTWLGAAPERPYHNRIFKSGWHHFWDFSGGDLADDGIHQLDLALMLMGDPGPPKGVHCTGGRFQHKGDDSEVPDLQVATFEFDDFLMTFEHSNYPKYMRKTTSDIRRNAKHPFWTQNATRIELYGSEEMMIVGRHGGGWISMGKYAEVTQKVYGEFPDPNHQENFLSCVKSRKRPNADIETLHPSCVTLHTANIAHQIGNQKVRFDAEKERFIDNDAANALVKRRYRKKFEVAEKV